MVDEILVLIRLRLSKAERLDQRLLERLVPRYAAGLQNILRDPLTLLGVAGLDHVEHLLRLWVVRHRGIVPHERGDERLDVEHDAS